VGDYEIPLGKARIVKQGTDLTCTAFPALKQLKFLLTLLVVIGWGAQMGVLQAAVDMAEKELGISIELIDLRTILPWDEVPHLSSFLFHLSSLLTISSLQETVYASVKKTGRVIISHEAPKTGGFAAELGQSIQEKCFTSLQVLPFAPFSRIRPINVSVF